MATVAVHRLRPTAVMTGTVGILAETLLAAMGEVVTEVEVAVTDQPAPIKALIFDFFGVIRVAGPTGAVVNRPVLELIAELKKTYKIALLSNTGSSRLGDFLPPESIAAYFDAVITPEQSPKYVKPAPEAYLAVAEKLALPPAACVMIDDLPGLCQGARAVGMQAIEYISFPQLKQELRRLLSGAGPNGV